MKPLIILIAVFCVALIISRIATGEWNIFFGGNLAMCLMLFFTASGHFIFTTGMAMMIPDPVPFKREIVYLSAVAEIVLALALLFPSMRYFAGIILIVMFVVLLPANIHAAIKHVNYETATFNGQGLTYLSFRVPMQIFLILWVFYFSVKG